MLLRTGKIICKEGMKDMKNQTAKKLSRLKNGFPNIKTN
jgi:hypothetical protein